MSIYALSDLHLSLGTDKPMDVFGGKWENYTEKLYENWQRTVSNDDLVIIPGDISWAMYIEDSYNDFDFINKLNGKKVILKGNHDYWWTTMKKMEEFLISNNFDTIKILHNSAIAFEDAAICGTRGWSLLDETPQEEDVRIFDRECKRLILSLEEASRLKKDRIIVGMHYPPTDKDKPNGAFLEIMKQYNVKCCVYGHLHSYSHNRAVEGINNGINLRLVSSDYINFTPVLI